MTKSPHFMSRYHHSSAFGERAVALMDRSDGEIACLGDVTEEIWDSVAEVDQEAWEHVRKPDDLFLDLRLLRALEISMSECSRFRFVLYRSPSAEPIAIAVLSTFEIDIGVLADDDWSRWILKCLRSVSTALVEHRILFCGLPLSACQSSLRFADGIDTAPVLEQLHRTLTHFAKKDKARVVVLKEFADEELPALKPLERMGYRKADSLPTNLVHLQSTSFEGYLHDVGKKRRATIKRSMKKLSAGGIEFVTTSDLDTIKRLFTPEVYQMYESVLRRSKTRLEHLTPNFFIEMARQLPDCCEFTFAMDGPKVVAFYISLWAGHEYRWLYMGYDESINDDVHLYFNLSFRAIEDAIRHDTSFAEIGQNSDYVKRTKLGAVQSRRSFYIRGVRRSTDWVIGKLFNQLFPRRPLYIETKEGQAADDSDE